MIEADTSPDQDARVPKPTRRVGVMDGAFELPDDRDTVIQAEIEEMFRGGWIEPASDLDEPTCDKPPRQA